MFRRLRETPGTRRRSDKVTAQSFVLVLQTAMDIQKLLSWIIIGIVALIAINLVGLLINIGSAILSFALKVLAVVLGVALVVRLLEGMRTKA